MALELGALRDALVDAGADPDKARKAAEELAGYENRFDAIDRRLAEFSDRLTAVEGKVSLLTWMIGFNLVMTVALLWRVFTRGA
jgi:hypothetical protein